MQEEESKGISAVRSMNDLSKELDEAADQINDPSEFDNKKKSLKVEKSSIKDDKTLQIETQTPTHKSRPSNASNTSLQPEQKFGLDTPVEELSAALMSLTMKKGRGSG